MNRIFCMILLACVLMTACAPAQTPPPTPAANPAPSGTPLPTGTLAPSPTPEPTATPEPSPTPIEHIQDEAETGVILLGNAELHQWVLGELAKEGKTIRELENMSTEGRGVRWAFTGEDDSILMTETMKISVPIGVRTVELPGHPGGKLRCLILNGIADQTKYSIPVALDAQDAEGTWTLLLPGVDATSPSEVAEWVEENKFKMVDIIKVVNVLTDPTYLDDPSWTRGLAGDVDLRNRIIGDSYVGWGTRDPYDLAINGEKYRKQNTTLDQMFRNRSIGLATVGLMQNLQLLNEHKGRSEACLIGAGIEMK